MTRRDDVPARVSDETESRLQLGVLMVLMGEIEGPDARRAVSEYMRKCRESRVRMETAA